MILEKTWLVQNNTFFLETLTTVEVMTTQSKYNIQTELEARLASRLMSKENGIVDQISTPGECYLRFSWW